MWLRSSGNNTILFSSSKWTVLWNKSLKSRIFCQRNAKGSSNHLWFNYLIDRYLRINMALKALFLDESGRLNQLWKIICDTKMIKTVLMIIHMIYVKNNVIFSYCFVKFSFNSRGWLIWPIEVSDGVIDGHLRSFWSFKVIFVLFKKWCKTRL